MTKKNVHNLWSWPLVHGASLKELGPALETSVAIRWLRITRILNDFKRDAGTAKTMSLERGNPVHNAILVQLQ